MWLAAFASLALGAAPGPLPELDALQAALRGGSPVTSAKVDSRVALAAAAHLWRDGRFAEAANLLAGAEPDPVLEPFVRFQLGEALAYDRRPAEAAEVFAGIAAGGDPVVAPAARDRWAEAELTAGHPARAAELLAKCLAAPGLHAPALREELGRALLATGDRAAAAAAFRSAWLQDPDDPASREARDELAGLEGERSSGPAPSPARVLRRARQLLQAGHPQAAHSDLAEIEAETASPRVADREELFMAQADRALGNDDEALAHWTRAAASRDPVVAAAAKIAQARAVESKGRWEDAVALLDRVAIARRGKGDGAEAEYLSAWYRLEHGKTEAALAGFARLAAHAGRRHADEALWWRGWTLYTQGRFEAAAVELEKLAARTRSSFAAQALYWEARAWRALGRKERAAEALSRLRTLDRGSFYGWLAEGESERVPAVAHPANCNGETPSGPFTLELRRAAELWALGYRRFVAPELERAARLARGPRELWAVSQVDAALDEPGRAFALLASGRAACAEEGERTLALFPRPFRGEVERAAQAAGLDPLLIWSVMRQESRFRPEARSTVQAIGAMQLLGATSRRIDAIAGCSSAPRGGQSSGIDAAAWYLRALSERFGGNAALVAAAYNAGPDPVAAWLLSTGSRPLDEFIERIPFRETRRYVKSVLANYAGYRALFGQAGAVIDPERAPGEGPANGVAF
ncbi:MAG: lytic transglycosylase domain-containing protein [Myxococcales bacterium]